MKGMNELERLCKPQSVAIIGCSENFKRLNGRPLKFLLDNSYNGKIYPVNPKYQEIAGLVCYPSMKDVPELVDVAMVLVPARKVEAALRECVEAKTRFAIVFSSGFAETGDEGKAIQEKIQELCLHENLSILGPNCLGLINLVDNIPLTFSSAMDIENLCPGQMALVSQSGAIGTFILGVAHEAQVGFAYWISSGNEVGLEVSSLTRFLLEDNHVKCVLLYMEEARNFAGLRETGKIARELGKTIIALKVGRSASGEKAALHHTASRVGDDEEYDALFKEFGIVRAEGVEELLDLGIVFSDSLKPKGNRVAIVSMSGGAGILLADWCENEGLAVPELGDKTREDLSMVIPLFGSVRNPIDVTAEIVANPELLKKTMEIVLADPNSDSVLVFLGLQKKTGVEIAEGLAEIAVTARQQGKPVIVAWMAPPREAVEILRAAHMPLLFDGVRAVKCLAKLNNS